jgi:glucuronate isomerase
MSKLFLSEEFLLTNRAAERLYHEFAENEPIFDYHCHLSPACIAEDRVFENITQVWLAGDHYKWRAMRTNGIDERFCTGDATDADKFQKWAETVPFTLRNPLYHWTHLELKRYFGIDGKVLNGATAREIYDKCSRKLNGRDFSVRNLLRKMKVKCVCTTDDPVDDLVYHRRIHADKFEVRVIPTFRPDMTTRTANNAEWNAYVDRLATAAKTEISSYKSLVEALRKRHAFFHEMGCRASDHGMETAYAEEFTERDLEKIVGDLRAGRARPGADQMKLKSALMLEFGRMAHERGWVMHLHIGALRGVNTRLTGKLGADKGFDAIGDLDMAAPLARFLDSLDKEERLPKTVLYNLNPGDNEVMVAMAGCFQDGATAGKIQYGPGWWFLDQKDGMERQMNALSSMGLLSRFIGMTTDSRSFLSFPRHEYFRRILCNLLGVDMERGEMPDDFALVGGMVKNICYENARSLYGVEL